MSYPIDLEEIREVRLQGELVRRELARADGVCDYCGRVPSSPTCKFPERHTDRRIKR